MISGRFLCRARDRTLQQRLAETAFIGPGFDQIRLVAATTVLLHHSRGVEYDAQADALFSYSNGFVHFGLLAVLVFFVISGFLVTPGLARSGNIVEYATNRALRIFPGLAVVVLVSMAVLGPVLTSLPVGAYFSDPHLYLYSKNILTLTYNYLPGVASGEGPPIIVNGALWTLHFEVLSYTALAVLSLSGMLRRPRAVLLVFLASYALYVAGASWPVVEEVLPGRLITFDGLFVYFAAAVMLYTYRDTVPYSAALATLALALLLVALPIGAGAVVAPLCLPYLVIFLGLQALPCRTLVRRDLSYGVYLIHAPVLAGFSILYPGVQPWWLVAFIVACLTLGLAYCSSRFVEGPALARKKTVSGWARNRVSRWQNTTNRWLRLSVSGDGRAREQVHKGLAAETLRAPMLGRPPADPMTGYERSSGANP